jgi:hypothetical protein
MFDRTFNLLIVLWHCTGFRLHLGVQGMTQEILRVPINITVTKLMSLILKDKGVALTSHINQLWYFSWIFSSWTRFSWICLSDLWTFLYMGSNGAPK